MYTKRFVYIYIYIYIVGIYTISPLLIFNIDNIDKKWRIEKKEMSIKSIYIYICMNSKEN